MFGFVVKFYALTNFGTIRTTRCYRPARKPPPTLPARSVAANLVLRAQRDSPTEKRYPPSVSPLSRKICMYTHPFDLR